MIFGNLPPTTVTNNTVDFFDNFFVQTFNTSQDVNDTIIGYFQEVTGDHDNGITLAASVLFTAQQQGIKPIELLDEFRKLNTGELNAYLTMFLNINRIGTSLLGLSNSPQTSPYVKRAILP